LCALKLDPSKEANIQGKEDLIALRTLHGRPTQLMFTALSGLKIMGSREALHRLLFGS